MSQNLKTLFLLGVLLPSMLIPARSAQPKYLWERMNIVRVAPSEVFARLGLTHNTRHGYTRDGFKKTDPDPTFPAGLTDVVPYDISHILLVRGTAQGLADFRARVLAAENDIATSGKWHVTVDLLPTPVPGMETLATPLGTAKEQDEIPDVPFSVTVGDPAQSHTYQLRLHVRPDGSLDVACQSGLLPTPPVSAQSVWTPPQVWTVPVSHIVPAGGTALFDDFIAVKQAARQKIGLPLDAAATDFQVRVVATPLIPASVPVSMAPTPPISVITPTDTPPQP